jgi:hypothetical protein
MTTNPIIEKLLNDAELPLPNPYGSAYFMEYLAKYVKFAEAYNQLATTEANKRIKELESKVAELKEDLIELRQQTNIRCAQVQERDAKIYELQASNNRLREAFEKVKAQNDKYVKNGHIDHIIDNAIYSTPAESLQAHDKEVIALQAKLKIAVDALKKIDNGINISNIEKCIHGKYGYEDCECCLTDIAIEALKQIEVK